MKKTGLFFLTFLIFQLQITSAISGIYPDDIDSLKTLLHNPANKPEQINLLILLANKYNESNIDSALFYAYSALTKANRVNDKKLIAQSCGLLGSVYRNKEMDDSSYYFLHRALNIFQEINDIENYIYINISLGEFYRGKHELNMAASFVHKAIGLSREHHLNNHLPYAFNRLGAIAFELSINSLFVDSVYPDSLLKAIAFTDSSLFWSEKIKTKKFNSSNYNILGACFTYLKEYDKANGFLMEALKDAAVIDKPMIYRNLGMNFLKKKNYEKAGEMGLAGVRISDSLRLSSGLLQNYYLLYLIEREQGNYIAAFLFLHNADSLQLVVYNEKTTAKIKEFEARYRYKENELLIEQQNHELSSKQNQFIFILVALGLTLLVLFVVLFFILRIRKMNRSLKNKNVEIEDANVRLLNLTKYKEDLTSMIVHDLKNPLNSIINYTRVKNQHENYDPQNIEGAAHKMLDLVNNIIDVQKFEETKYELNLSQISLNSLVKSALQNVQVMLNQKNISVDIRIVDSVLLKCDRELIERVFVNLLTNAIKFSPNNKTISIETELNNELVKIKIMDEGPGIAADKIPLLFNKFARAEIRKIGFSTSSGLGLAFSKLVIEAHGGTIGVEPARAQKPELNDGACFWFTLKFSKSDDGNANDVSVKHESELIFSNELSAAILPLKKILANFRFYETSEILDAVNNYQCTGREFTLWKTKVENAVLNSNKESYLELIK